MQYICRVCLQPSSSLSSLKQTTSRDLHVQGLIQMLGGQHRLHLVEDMSSIEEAITEEVAVIMLTQVNYRTGRLLDMRSITAAAHSKWEPSSSSPLNFSWMHHVLLDRSSVHI